MKTMTLQKFVLIILVPIASNAMDNKVQATLTSVGHLSKPEFISSAKFRKFKCTITPAQKEILENVLMFKSIDRKGIIDLNDTEAEALSVSSFLALPSLELGLFVVLAVLAGNDEAYRKAYELLVPYGLIMPIIAATILVQNYIRHSCRKTKSDRIFKQYIAQGQQCGLGAIAESLVELLEHGSKGQTLCLATCNACSTKRKECLHCSDFYSKLVGTGNSEQKICTHCWENICSRCEICSTQRQDDRISLMTSKLDLAVDRKCIDIHTLDCYLQAIIKKQVEYAKYAV